VSPPGTTLELGHGDEGRKQTGRIDECIEIHKNAKPFECFSLHQLSLDIKESIIEKSNMSTWAADSSGAQVSYFTADVANILSGFHSRIGHTSLTIASSNANFETVTWSVDSYEPLHRVPQFSWGNL
jgi:hypothetical protein